MLLIDALQQVCQGIDEGRRADRPADRHCHGRRSAGSDGGHADAAAEGRVLYLTEPVVEKKIPVLTHRHHRSASGIPTRSQHWPHPHRRGTTGEGYRAVIRLGRAGTGCLPE